LRLIGVLNPWAAKDSGATWQKIATQIHDDTKHVTVLHPRTKKVVSCQVMATNGQALMMWYIRQVEKMDKAYKESRDKGTSGQTNMREKAIQVTAAATNDNPADIQKEWDQIRKLKDLKDSAEAAKRFAKDATFALKRLKDDEMPKEIMKVACDSKEVCIQGIKLLHKKKKQWEHDAQLAIKLGRAPVATEQHKQDMELLAELQRQRKTFSDCDDDEEEEAEATTASDGKGRKNERGLKGSFGMLTEAVQQVTTMLQHDDSKAQATSRTLTASQLKSSLAQLDADVGEGGLKLEQGERGLVRELLLKRYAHGLGNL
jgi:hypothetical protein